MIKSRIFAAVLALMGSQAWATDYFVVVPVHGRPNAVQVALAPAALPEAKVGAAYNFEFAKSLVVTGDTQFTGAGVAWAIADGVLPAGLSLDGATGVLRGTAAAQGTAEFLVTAAYKARTAEQRYALAVVGTPAFSVVGSPVQTQLLSATALGAVSDPKVINLKNSGTAAGDFTLPSFGGANASQFSATNTCAAVPINGNCAVSVTWNAATTTADATLALAGTTYAFKGTLKQLATWDPANTGPGYVLSDNNLTVTNTGSMYTGTRATMGRSTGKWYWEMTVAGGPDRTELMGIVKSTVNMKADKGCFGCTTSGTNNWRAVYPSSGGQTVGWPGTTANTTNLSGTSLATSGASYGDTYGFALDVDARTLTVYYTPVGGTCLNHAILQWVGLEAATWYPAVSTGGRSWVASANFGSYAFKCPAPAGYQVLQ